MARTLYRLIGMAMLVASVGGLSAQQVAAVRGIVRDAEGVPQMGVAVQLVGGNAQVVANSFTDLNGRFAMRNLVPGIYQLRATATLYLPVLRDHLQLRPGDLSTINLTLNGLFEQAWPNAVAAHRGDLHDDWRWTLRSSANRPLLRVFEQDQTQESTSTEMSHTPGRMRRVASVTQTSGRFGGSGTRVAVEQQRASVDRASTSFAHIVIAAPGTGSEGFETAFGLESHPTFSPARKAAVRLRSASGTGTPGFSDRTSVLDAAAGQRLLFGDVAEVEAGTLLRAVRSGQTGIASYPFLRAMADAGRGWEIGYSLAGSPDCQGLDDIGREMPALPAIASVAGRLELEHGLHQAAYVRRHLGRGLVQATLDHDVLRTVAVSGHGATAGGWPTVNTAASPPEAIDSTNGLFRQMLAGYTSNGWRVLVSYPVGNASTVSMEYVDGVALAAKPGLSRSNLAAGMAPERAQSARLALQSTVAKTGTHIEAAYAWQPTELVSVMSPYSGSGNGAYLSVHLRQPVRAGGVLPEGTVITVEGDNLAKQGYVVLASADIAEAAALASTMRTLQAGLAFTF